MATHKKQPELFFESEIGSTHVSFADANEERFYDRPMQHFHSAYEFQYVIEGSLSLKTNSTQTVVEKGQFVLIPPDVFHWTELSSTTSRYAVLFSISSSSACDNNFSFLDSIDRPIISTSPDIDFYAKRVYSASRNNDAPYRIKHYLEGLFIILSDFVESMIEKEACTTFTRVKPRQSSLEVRGIIDDILTLYYNESGMLGKIAGTLHMSKRNAARVVYKLFSCPLKDLVTRQRMNCALSFITDTDLPLCDISLKVGYNTYSAFYKAFKKYYGKPPESYRV